MQIKEVSKIKNNFWKIKPESGAYWSMGNLTYKKKEQKRSEKQF